MDVGESEGSTLSPGRIPMVIRDWASSRRSNEIYNHDSGLELGDDVYPAKTYS